MIKKMLATLLVALSVAMIGQATAAAAPVGTASVGDSVRVSLDTAALSTTASKKLKTSWSWYIARASGIIAGVLLGLLVISGVGMLTGLTYRMLEPLPAWAIHRAIGLSFGVLVVVHIVVLLFDKFVGFSIGDVLIPFASTYQPSSIAGQNVGSLWVATGIMAFYSMIIIVVTSLLWMQSKPKTWHTLHYLSYFVLGLVFLHGLFLGTDLKHGFWRFLWVLGAVIVAAFIVTRLRRARTIVGGRH